jgi:hypothetical protein
MTRVTVKLTGGERTLIDAIRWLATKGGYTTLPEIAARTGQTPQGVAEVAISARRKDLVRRVTGRGHVHYKLTDKGWALAKPRAQQVAGELVPLSCGHSRRADRRQADLFRFRGYAHCRICGQERPVRHEG